MHRILSISVLLCALGLLFSSTAMGFDIRKPASSEIFLGYGYDSTLKNTDDEYAHLTAAFDFSYPFAETGMWRNFEFQLEPFLSYVTSPDDNAEIGCVFFIKYTLPLNFPVKPYVRGGSGVILLTQETEEQSTLFNFASQMGYGLSCEIKDIDVFVEYRNRHVSNASIKQPNDGLDSYIWLVGIRGLF